MRQLNGCSTPAPRSSGAKQWFQRLAQKKKKKLEWQIGVNNMIKALRVIKKYYA